MSLKENIDYIKQEISTEEKFFENFFKIEKFWKKYKLIIIILLLSIIGYFIFNSVSSYIKETNDVKANTAYNKLIKNPNDKQSLKILEQTNQTLLSLAIYKNSKDNTLQNDIIYLKEIAQFNKAIKNNDIKALDELLLNPNFILRDYALFNKALILTNNKLYSKAKQTLALIPEESDTKAISNLLKHYLLTK